MAPVSLIPGLSIPPLYKTGLMGQACVGRH
jgi:hypothetical protein